MKAWANSHLSKFWLFGILTVVAIIYRNSFVSPFFQDDKLFLNLNLPGDFLKAIPAFHYHPISNQLFYGLSKSLFGFNYFWYHIFLFSFFSISLVFVYKIAIKFLQSNSRAVLAVFFWALNVSIFPNFYWIAVSYFVIGACFFFGSFYFFTKTGQLNLAISLLFFLAAIGSNEASFTLPLVLVLYTWYKKQSWRRLAPFILLTPILLVARIVMVGFSSSSSYSMRFDTQVFGTLRWYILRGLNLPEGVQRSSPIIYLLFGLLCLVLVVAVLVYSRSKKRNIRLIFFSTGYFLATALPFFFLPNHMSSYYLTFALVGPALIFSEILPKKLIIIAVVVYLSLTIFGLEFLSKTHWIILKNTGPIGQFKSL